MRKLIVGPFVTLDGVMQAPGGPGEDRDGGFRHGGRERHSPQHQTQICCFAYTRRRQVSVQLQV